MQCAALQTRNAQPAADNTVQHVMLTTRCGAQGKPSANNGETADGIVQYLQVLGYLTACNVERATLQTGQCRVRTQQKTRSMRSKETTAYNATFYVQHATCRHRKRIECNVRAVQCYRRHARLQPTDLSAC